MAAAAISPRRRSSPRARGCRDRATATPSASKRFAFALRKLRSRCARISLSPLRLVLAAVAVVAAVVLWFIFTAMSVSLLTVPTAANVRVSGGLPAVRLGDRVLLRPGNYHVRAELPGFVPAQLPIKVTKAPNQAFTMTLAKLPGRCASTFLRPRASRSTARKRATRRAISSSQPGATASRSRRSAISPSAPTSTSKASARRRRSSRSWCRAGASSR